MTSRRNPPPLAEPPPGEVPGGGPPRFVDAHDARHRLLVALSKIGIALRAQAWRDAAPRGLTPTQAQILVVLGRSAGGGVRLSVLAATLGVKAPTVSDSVSALERKDLVRKAPAADDARALAITLTPAGRRQARAIAEWPDPLLSTVDVLDDEEQSIFLRALMKIIRELQERGEIAPSRMCVTCRYFRPSVHADPLRPHHCDFVDAPFGDRNLRVECAEHEAADAAHAAATWSAFTAREAAG